MELKEIREVKILNCPECGSPLKSGGKKCSVCLYEVKADRFIVGERQDRHRRKTIVHSLTNTESAHDVQSLEGESLFRKRYDIREKIAKGATSVVYKAFDTESQTLVAIKMLHPTLVSNEDIVERFHQEGRILRNVDHKNIVRVYDFGVFRSYPYIVMEYVSGHSLRQYLEQQGGRLSSSEAMDIMMQLCQGMVYAHHYMIHRDLKPENIMLTENHQVKVMDFGISRLRERVGGVHIPTDGDLGTAYYVSPEQAEQADSVDERADIYSLGVILFEMCMGHLPLGAFKISSVKDSFISDNLVQIIETALAMDRNDRFVSVKSFLKELQAEKVRIDQSLMERDCFGTVQRSFKESFNVSGDSKKDNSHSTQSDSVEKSSLWLRFSFMFIIIVFSGLILGSLGYGAFFLYEKGVFQSLNFRGHLSDLVSIPESQVWIQDKESYFQKVHTKQMLIPMVYIKGGEYYMGEPSFDSDYASVELDSFYIGEHEVSNYQYFQFIQDTGHPIPENVFGEDSEYSLWEQGRPSREIWHLPVVNVSFYDAIAFCRWLCDKEGVYIDVYRLPTEAEWEKAAKSDLDYRYAWGDSPPSVFVANYNKEWEGLDTFENCRSYVQGEFEVCHLSGNVSEWCLDIYSKKRVNLPSKNPLNLLGDNFFRVIRGGNWSSYSASLRTFSREYGEVDMSYFHTGFRVVRSLSKEGTRFNMGDSEI